MALTSLKAPSSVDIPGFTSYSATYKRAVSGLVDQLLSGKLTVDQWRAAMLLEISYLVMLAYASGKGGLANLTDADRDVIARKTAEQQVFINRWADQLKPLADGAGFLVTGAVLAGIAAKAATAVWQAGQAISAAGLLARAMLYVESARAVIQLAHGLVLGMPELPAYPKDGQSACLFYCYCHWDIAHLGKRDWDCTWVIDPERDNCKQCVNRAIQWRPLQIRNGVIQPYNTSGLFI